jgi:hypothetical protein
MTKTKQITFTNTSSIPALYPPKPANKFLPDWYKKQNAYLTDKVKAFYNVEGPNTTIKKCLPVLDSMSMGYLLFTQNDIFVEQRDNGEVFYHWRAEEPSVYFHPPKQADHHPEHNPEYSFPKFYNTWGITTPIGYSTLFKAPAHGDFSTVFAILEGVVDTDSFSHPTQFPFVLKDKKWTGTIPAGTPIAQAIPIKREVWNSKIGGEEERKTEKLHKALLMSRVFNSYKTSFWHKKEYK